MKKLLLTLLALSFALMAFAQVDITIGSGTSTGRYPLNDYFKYSRSQSLYMESEIGAPGTIHKLRWYRNDTGANTAAIATTQIWLKSVTNAVLTGTDWEDPGTLVAEITDIDLGAGGGWYEVDITDFAYSGGHLLVSVYTQNAPYTSPHAYWRYTSTTGINTIRSGNSDSSNPPSLSLGTSRPNIQINMTASSPTSAPNPAAILSPTDEALNVALDASLNWSSGGGFPDGYYLSFGTVDPYTTILDGEDMEGDTSYEPQNLAYGTEYWWQVVPYNTYGNATACPTWSFTTMADPTILADDLPHTENFDGVTDPDFPMGWDSITNTSNSFASFGTYTYSTPNSTPNHVRMYNSGDAEAEFTLITPPIDSDIASLRVKFYAKYSSGGYLDVGVWDGSTFSSVETVTLNTSYIEHIVNLDSYVGAGDKIAFYGYFDGTYQYIYLDDITIEEIPTAPIISVVPDTWDFGTMPINTTTPKEFTVSNVGAGTLTVNSINVTGTGFALADAFTTVSLLANESSTFTVNFAPTTEGTYSGNIAINDNRAATNISLSGTGYPSASLPLTENWESGQGDWMIANGTQTNAWYIGTADPYAGANSAYISNDGGVTNAYTNGSASVTHLYRDIAFDANMLEFPLSFMWKCEGEGTAWDRMRVHLVDPSVTPVAGNELTIGQVGLTNYNVQADWVLANITLPGTLSGSVKRLVFSWKNDSSSGTQPPINIDDISLTAVDLPAEPEFVYSPNAINFGTVTNAALTGPQIVTISNNGGGELAINASDISISGANATEFSFAADNLPASLGFGESVEIPVFVTGVTEGAISATLTINYDSVDYDVALSANVLGEGLVAIGNGTANNSI
ncbi:MAG: choice-of-anchor D domain-containing protein, partial [Candidatus Cloacimonetes bacterium]|nr:choice-of-anchor D domain-containing protein [Candidatus Cloacimonadota bacterium]